MARLYLVRHGEAASTFADAVDPGLSTLGKEQAEAAAQSLKARTPLTLISSPLVRAQETAAPFAQLTKKPITIAEAVAEIPSPGIPLGERRAWLMKIMAGTWRNEGKDLIHWRDGVTAFLSSLKQDTAVFSHFIAINVSVGAAIGRDDVVCFSPANCSITIMETTPGGLRLIEKGAEASTVVR